jgi:hypothetical protein
MYLEQLVQEECAEEMHFQCAFTVGFPQCRVPVLHSAWIESFLELKNDARACTTSKIYTTYLIEVGTSRKACLHLLG